MTIPSICDERIELYLARELSHSATSHEADEVIRVEWLELAAVIKMIRSGDIIDAKTIAAILSGQRGSRRRKSLTAAVTNQLQATSTLL